MVKEKVREYIRALDTLIDTRWYLISNYPLPNCSDFITASKRLINYALYIGNKEIRFGKNELETDSNEGNNLEKYL